MKPLRWTSHADKKLVNREVDRSEVERTLEHPDEVVGAYPGRDIYQRCYYDKILGQEMLLRVVVEETASELIVVTLYKTSQLARYARRPLQ